MKDKLPTAIDNPPIIESLVELRFNTPIIGDLIVGQLHGILSSRYPIVERLPGADVPAQLRFAEPNFKFGPHFSLSNEDFRIGIGTNVLSFACKLSKDKNYPGWKVFKAEFDEMFTLLENSGILKEATYSRLGIRYINFFDSEDLWETTNVTLTSPWDVSSAKDHEVYYGLTFEEAGLKSNLRVAANAQVVFDNQQLQGLVVDIDTYREDEIPAEDISGLIEKGHKEVKRIFFGFVKDDYVSKRNPK